MEDERDELNQPYISESRGEIFDKETALLDREKDYTRYTRKNTVTTVLLFSVLFLVIGTVILVVSLPKYKPITIQYNTEHLKDKTENVLEETTIGQIPVPDIAGYKFLGWYQDEEYTIPYEDTDILTESKVYAKLQVLTYEINYDSEGGSIVYGRRTYNVETETFDLPKPTKTGYTFAGWKRNGKEIINKHVKGTTGNSDLVAVWNIISYKISLPPQVGFKITASHAIVNNTCTVNWGTNFTFTIVLDTEYSQSIPVVKVGENVIQPTSGYTYTIESVTQRLDVTITGIVLNSSAVG